MNMFWGEVTHIGRPSGRGRRQVLVVRESKTIPSMRTWKNTSVERNDRILPLGPFLPSRNSQGAGFKTTAYAPEKTLLDAYKAI